MTPDPVPPLVFVEDPVHEDAVETLVCPVCWRVTAVWLGKPMAKCEVCERCFDAAPGVA
jgi:hypothetical protein